LLNTHRAQTLLLAGREMAIFDVSAAFYFSGKGQKDGGLKLNEVNQIQPDRKFAVKRKEFLACRLYSHIYLDLRD